MKLNIIAVGKLEKHFQIILEKYLKKISYFCDINIIEIKEKNDYNINVKIQKETQNIIDRIPKNSKVILCSLSGIELNSYDFSSNINQDNISFVIGGSNGVDESLFTHKICFSKMTFPHQLFRIFLVEQIYRAFTIKNKIKYHK